MKVIDSSQEILKADAAYRKASKDNFVLFCSGLVIPSAAGPQEFGSCIEDFQLQCLQNLEPSLVAVRAGKMPPIRRFWWERTKKASKDSDLGLCLLWLCAFSTRPLYIQVGAADKDQAGIVKRRISDICFHNPWLADLIDIQRYKILNREGLCEVDIIAADIAGSHGETPDVLVINELSHVTKWEFVENLLDNADGVPRGLVCIATNAGFKGTKAEVLRRNAKDSEDWYFHSYTKPAPWINPRDVADAEKRNSHTRFKRLWYGVWASGKGDAVDEEDIDRCFSEELSELAEPERGWQYIAGLDLGVSHDHSGLCVVGVSRAEQQIRLAQLRAWEPGEDREVDLQAVEDACLSAHSVFHLQWLGYDPSQAKLMAQRLVRRGVPMREVTFTSQNLTRMATAFLQAVEGGILKVYDDLDGRLRRDFGKFSIVEKTYGYKLQAVSDEYGHADVGTALVIALLRAMEMLSESRRLFPQDDIVGDGEELSEEQVEEMPSELREMYEYYSEAPSRKS